MLAYYVGPGLAIEVAETPDACIRLEARGFTRCTSDYYVRLWRLRDTRRGRELRQEARVRWESAPLKGARHVYSGVLADMLRGKP